MDMEWTWTWTIYMDNLSGKQRVKQVKIGEDT